MRTDWANGNDRDGHTEGHSGRGRREPKVVVGAAIVVAGRVLACARSHPPEVAGRWEFPGGKVEPGESEVAALIRECAEELGVRVEIGDRVGRDVRMGHGRSVLRVYLAELVDGDQPQPLEHSELRWLRPEELDSVPWLPADVPIVAALRPLLAAAP
ncbi:DNA mismatch repair protein MutT [Plantactinospora sp. BC1]|nr:DNA mismatch repair protein MutT [Plantactinospora sp. BC1]